MGASAVDVVDAADLDREARADWARFRAARPELASPYFDLRYVLAASQVAPGAGVAVIRQDGEIAGFFPFQRRGGLIQPLAAPLTDYHGLISRLGADIDLPEVVAALGARRFRYSGLVPSGAVHGAGRAAMVADLSAGFDGWLAQRRAAGHGDFLRDKARRRRQLETKHGQLAFSLERRSGEVLELVLALKSRQMRRTGQHDVFSAPWTQDLLRRLTASTEADFGLRFAVLRAGERIVAAELGLISGDSYHLWFPIYDPEYAKFSPGALMTLASLEALAELGVRRVDFGPEGEDYKKFFADPAGEVVEGEVRVGPRPLGGLADAALDAAPPLLRRVATRLDRRLDRITACEPQMVPRMGQTLKSVALIGRRPRKFPAGASLGLAALGPTAE
ncbi:GNAT family N-acetyltransferase [Phenylobacterium sp.]|jgi:CelD/BcsL family acetyltransferase involved in cellulose biosynthesis|uniref:GNAT family N-acetyltransferase n=1 Tax=Phenylobacterium sp. TaxID=1871053 RepID=UPI002E37CFD9|nr:GNAT family N-acetyltransferase [Phenylobacterium sp.]HEX2562085.1 GNAT family N-acetyltransferase [Phenylobacterium sp.]